MYNGRPDSLLFEHFHLASHPIQTGARVGFGCEKIQQYSSYGVVIVNLKWTDVLDIAIELSETWQDVDPLTLNFVDLRAKVIALPDFDDDPDRCGEKVLEAIQAAWLDELD